MDISARIGHDALLPHVHDKIIADAAKAGLGRLGVVRKGRSRSWIDDHGWWLINIEFQPSGFSRGCYVNVGEQHLWVKRDHFCFEGFERLGGRSQFVAFNGEETAFASAMGEVVNEAVQAVERRRRDHGEGVMALRRVAEGNDDLNAGIAYALLEKTRHADRKLRGGVHPAYRDQAESFAGIGASEAASRATAAVRITREKLGLRADAAMAW